VDVLISSSQLLDRLGREEQQLKRLGLHAQAAGIRSAVSVLLRLSLETKDQQTNPPPAGGSHAQQVP
jgi:hypothetical protein